MSEVHIKTIGGASNVLNVDSDTPKILQFVAEITQVGVNIPTANVIINDFGGVPIYTRNGVGSYVGTLVGAFDETLNYSTRFDVAVLQKTQGLDPLGNSQPSLITGNPDTFIIKTSEWVANQIAPYNIDQLVSDDVLRGQRLFIKQFATILPITALDSFNIILSKLDGNQGKLWTKIVVRKDGTVTEVDGKIWRRTGDFALSSELINS